MYSYDHISLNSSWNEKYFRQNLVDKSKHIFFVQYLFFLKKNRTVYEIMWENVVQWGRPQVIIWRMRSACWITKATPTHSEYVILTALPSCLSYCATNRKVAGSIPDGVIVIFH